VTTAPVPPQPEEIEKAQLFTLREALFALALLVGLGLIVAGIALMHVPAAFIFAGLGLAGWSFLVTHE
jgi:hypothetical protein